VTLNEENAKWNEKGGKMKITGYKILRNQIILFGL
jgi:hypothetical protein